MKAGTLDNNISISTLEVLQLVTFTALDLLKFCSTNLSFLSLCVNYCTCKHGQAACTREKYPNEQKRKS